MFWDNYALIRHTFSLGEISVKTTQLVSKLPNYCQNYPITVKTTQPKPGLMFDKF